MPELILGVSAGFVPVVFVVLAIVRFVQLVGRHKRE